MTVAATEKGRAIEAYLASTPASEVNPGFLGFLAGLETIAGTAPEVARSIVQELADQRHNLKLIASENYSSLATQLAMGNLLTDKYAEGYPGHRFYAGCDNVDNVESYACKQACKLFGADHAYAQPHSGADANLIAYWAVLQARVGAPAIEQLGLKSAAEASAAQWAQVRQQLNNQRLLGMALTAGGHLTHGYRLNVSAMMFDAYSYGVSKETGLIDYDALEAQAHEVKPLILLAGYSAYPRAINFRRMREIADAVGAVFMVDMAHFAGLVAGGVFKGDFHPVKHAHVVTTTTHKTLRGPRGGLVLCTAEFAEYVDKGCPLVIGGPLPHVMAAKAVALTEANTKQFKQYAKQIVKNARALAAACVDQGLDVVSGGTDNHLLLVDVNEFGISGRQAEAALRDCGITLNKNTVPFDPNGPWYTSGIRLGTPAITTLGMSEREMQEIASVLKLVLANTRPLAITSGPNQGEMSKARYSVDEAAHAEARTRIQALLHRYPVYPELDLALLEEHFC